MMKNKLCILMLVSVFILSVMGTAAAQTKATTQVEEGKFVIGFIVKNLVNPFFVAMKEGAEQAGKDYGVDVRVYSPEKPDDVEAQIRIMEDMIQQNFDAIIIVPADSRGIISGIEKANKAGVPIFVANTRAFGGEFLTFAGISHTEIAQIMTEKLCQELEGKGNIVIISGVPGAQTTIDKKPGIEAALAKYPDVKILDEQTGMYQRENAMRVMQDFLVRYPNINGVMAQDDGMALGAIEAIRSAGKLGKIKVVGSNADPDALQSVLLGELTATIDEAPEKQAYLTTEAAIKYLMDGIVPPKELPVPLGKSIIDKNNVKEFMDRKGIK